MDKTVVVQLKALSKLGAAGRAAHTKLHRDLQRVRQHRQAGSHGDAHRIGGRRSRPSKRPLRITRASPRLHRFLHAVVAAGGAGMSSQEEAELHTKLELAEHEAAMQAGTLSEADMRSVRQTCGCHYPLCSCNRWALGRVLAFAEAVDDELRRAQEMEAVARDMQTLSEMMGDLTNAVAVRHRGPRPSMSCVCVLCARRVWPHVCPVQSSAPDVDSLEWQVDDAEHKAAQSVVALANVRSLHGAVPPLLKGCVLTSCVVPRQARTATKRGPREWRRGLPLCSEPSGS